MEVLYFRDIIQSVAEKYVQPIEHKVDFEERY